jgi:hypothetical protein
MAFSQQTSKDYHAKNPGRKRRGVKALEKEVDIQRVILDWCQLQGYLVKRINAGAVFDPTKRIWRRPGGFSAGGISDLIICGHHRKIPWTLFLEVKRSELEAMKGLRESQIQFSACLRRQLGHYAVCWDVRLLPAIIDRLRGTIDEVLNSICPEVVIRKGPEESGPVKTADDWL